MSEWRETWLRGDRRYRVEVDGASGRGCFWVDKCSDAREAVDRALNWWEEDSDITAITSVNVCQEGKKNPEAVETVSRGSGALSDCATRKAGWDSNPQPPGTGS